MKKILLLSFLSLLIFSCEDFENNSNSNSSNQFSQNFGQSVQRDFMGQIVDENNNPLVNAIVKIGSSQVNTDINGVFILKNTNVYEKFAFIKVEKMGFLNGSRSLVPTDGMNQVKIMMIANTPIATINTGESSEISLSNGTKVTFDGAFEDENGNSYSGAISVFAYHLETSNSNLADLMPGMLFAEAEDGSAKVLETFGMLNVELQGSGGQKLQIAEGHEAEISMKIDDTQLATATATIPLWHFDEENGYWKEEGEATRQGDYYVGNVSHFSWWNCDANFPTIIFSVRLINTNNEPLAYVPITIEFQGYDVYGMTMSNGIASGLVPANETLIIKIWDECNNLILSQQIGPYLVDTNYGDIVVNIPSTQQTVVSGTLLKCNNDLVQNGYVCLRKNGENIFYDVTNGAFSINKIFCPTNTDFKLIGVDYDNLQTTDSISYNFQSPITNVGNLIACNNVTEFISYQIDNNPNIYILTEITAGMDAVGGLVIHNFWSNSQIDSIYLWCNNFTVGNYTNFIIEDSNVGLIDGSNSSSFVYSVNYFGLVGDYIDVSFYGNYISTIDNQTHYISGVAHVIRDN